MEIAPRKNISNVRTSHKMYTPLIVSVAKEVPTAFQLSIMSGSAELYTLLPRTERYDIFFAKRSAMVDAVDELTSWYLNAIYRLFGPCRAMYLWMI
jgi:hypothetical protein